eukprot:6379794-Alexandrium_andersonii.AAC.1
MRPVAAIGLGAEHEPGGPPVAGIGADCPESVRNQTTGQPARRRGWRPGGTGARRRRPGGLTSSRAARVLRPST